MESSMTIFILGYAMVVFLYLTTNFYFLSSVLLFIFHYVFYTYFFLPSFLPTFLPPSLPSFLPTFLSSILPSFLHSFLPSFLLFFLPFFLSFSLPFFLPSFLFSFLPFCLSSPFSFPKFAKYWYSIQGARLWLLAGLVLGFGALIASMWILFGDFVVSEAPNQSRGVVLFLHNFLIFCSSLLYKFGRTEDQWAWKSYMLKMKHTINWISVFLYDGTFTKPKVYLLYDFLIEYVKLNVI